MLDEYKRQLKTVETESQLQSFIDKWQFLFCKKFVPYETLFQDFISKSFPAEHHDCLCELYAPFKLLWATHLSDIYYIPFVDALKKTEVEISKMRRVAPKVSELFID